MDNHNLENTDALIRPSLLKDLVGQEELKSRLEIYIKAAKKRDETLDHILLYGPPGLGKTTIANIIANEMGGKLKYCNGPTIESNRELAFILNDLNEGDILFIDEIHRIDKTVEEILYCAMEDFILSVSINNDPTGKVINLVLPPFTLIGASTKPGYLSEPLRARFGIIEKLDYYPVKDIENIIFRTSKILNFSIDKPSANLIAKRSRGTPRIANRIFKRVRDFASFKEENIINLKDTKNSLKLLGIDDLGLDPIDKNYLSCLIKRFKGGPVGLETISAAIGEISDNLEEMCEPYLIKLDLIDITRKGRVATKKAFEHLHLEQKN